MTHISKEQLLVLDELHQLQDLCEGQGQGLHGKLNPPFKKNPTKNLKNTPKTQEGLGMDEGVEFFQPEICLVLVTNSNVKILALPHLLSYLQKGEENI